MNEYDEFVVKTLGSLGLYKANPNDLIEVIEHLIHIIPKMPMDAEFVDFILLGSTNVKEFEPGLFVQVFGMDSFKAVVARDAFRFDLIQMWNENRPVTPEGPKMNYTDFVANMARSAIPVTDDIEVVIAAIRSTQNFFLILKLFFIR